MSWTGIDRPEARSDIGFLPEGGDPGEVLGVDENGRLEWVDPVEFDELPPDGEPGDVLVVGDGGQPEWGSGGSGAGGFNVVHDYGADPTGIVNATPSIQAAIDAAKANHGGVVYIPSGTYKLGSGLNLAGIGNGWVTLEGDSRLGSALMCAFNGGSAIDLTGSTRVRLASFALNKVAGFTPAQMLLLARNAVNDSAGNHCFENLHIDGTCANATVVVWGSEVNNWVACDIRSSVDKPALVCAVKISELGFTPSSEFMAVGSGSGGVGCNVFTGCIFSNGMETQQTSPLMRLFGANAWAFYGCYSYCDCVHTIEINVSSFIGPDPIFVYYPRITFESFEDEAGPFTAANKNSIYFSPFTADPDVVSRESCRGIHLRNCALFNIFGADGTIVDNLILDGGRYSPSFTALPAGHNKLSLYRVTNSLIAPSACEKNLDYIVRNGGSGLTFRGIEASHLSLTGVTSANIVDDAGKLSIITGWESGMQSGCSIDPGPYGIATFDAFGPARRFYFSQPTSFTEGHIGVGGIGVPSPSIILAGAAGTNRDLILQTDGNARWCLRTNSNAEGSTADGSNFVLVAFNNDGSTIDAPLYVGRAAGLPVTLSRPLVLPSLPPASSAAAGATGTIAWDDGFIYVKTSTVWKRAALVAW